MMMRLSPKPALVKPAPDHFKQLLQESPFAKRAMPLCRTRDVMNWNGFALVNVYSTVEEEYFAIRNRSSVFDLAPMMKYRISGKDAEAYCNRLVTRDVRKQKPGRVSYVVWCDEAGMVIDDGTLFRFSATEFRLCSQERQIDWLLDCALGYDVTISDVSESIMALTLQGPTSASLLKLCGFKGVENIKPFEIKDWKIGKLAVTVSRTGFTADLGYELWVDAGDAIALWDLLFEHGQGRGLVPIGNEALNMARIEAGLLLPGIDFISSMANVRMGFCRSPYELGLDFTVDLAKPHFNGRAALVAEKQNETSRSKLIGLEIESNKPVNDSIVYSDESCQTEIGFVTSAIWSPTCKRNIAIAQINAPYYGTLTQFWVELYLKRELTWQRRVLEAWPVERPFFAHPRRRQTPAGDY
ncbi:MAG: aminomethyltransferase family protein [Candidatus Pacebacteria bacterium]|nr:aminomethyltransferase family protein [Candidatus Paceibacterota bacterium]